MTEERTIHQASAALDRLAAARLAFVTLRPRVEAGDPWPLAVDFGSGPEAAWGPREVLAHTAEMLPYWQGEFERIVEGGLAGVSPMPFGRVATDPLRIAVLERDRTLPLRELFDRIDAGIGRWHDRVREVTPEEGSALGVHPRLGEMSADGARDRFVVEHLEEHAAQLETILGFA